MGIDSHSEAPAPTSAAQAGGIGTDDSPEWTALEAELRVDLAPNTEILRLLGRGSAASVYLAREVALRRLVAIKVLSPSSEKVTRLRFEREGQAVAAILHPNLIPVFRVDRLPGGIPYLVMPYIKGRSLAERIGARTTFETAEVRRIITELAGALAAAHRRGIVHRDVKPANVLCEDETGRIYLMDFGIAGMVESGEHMDLQLTRAGEVLGDSQYMSPEQAAGRSVTELADVYSLALLGSELLTSGATSEADTASGLDRVRKLRPEDGQLLDLLARCLQANPQHRPSAAEIIRLLSVATFTEEIVSASSRHTHGRLAAVWFADIVGYTRLAAEDKNRALEIVAAFQDLSRAEIADHGGRLVKFIGDAALAEFSSTSAAVHAAADLQRSFVERSTELGRRSDLRIGVHVGEIEAADDGDIYGDGVNTASRLQCEAEPGHVLVSEDVWRSLRSHAEFSFAAAGRRRLRGTSSMTVFEALPSGDRSDARTQRLTNVGLSWLRGWRLSTLLILYAAVGWLLLYGIEALVLRGVLAGVAYEAARIWYLGVFPLLLLVAWFHGYRRHRRAPTAEKILAGAFVLVLLALTTAAVSTP